MKKFPIVIILLYFSTHLWSIDTVLLDFESASVPSTVSSWINHSVIDIAASVWSAPNPSPTDPINTTTNCYKITKQANDPYWTGLEVSFATATPITTANQYLHVMVYKSTTSRITLTYTPEGGTQSADAWQTNNTVGAWIDFVLPVTTGINLKTIAIKIGDAVGIYYIDQISLSDNPASLSRTDINIDPTIKKQIIEGWGGSLCWWANIIGGYSDARIKYICDWIVDPVNGLNMNVFRFNIGGGDDPTHHHMRTDGGAMPGYKASATAPYDWTQDVNQRKVIMQLIASRIERKGVNDIKMVAFSNSPPFWMTRSGCSAGSTEGNVTNLRSDMFTPFADYLTEVVKYYHDNLGITFDYIEPFNEPDGRWWKALGNQEGCYFSESDQVSMIRELYAKMQTKNMFDYTQITANDANSLDAGYNAFNTYKNAGDIIPKIKMISVHTYGGNQRSGIANIATAYNLNLWQSESGPIGIGGTNEHQILTMADRIITDIKDLKCRAWVDWQLVGSGSSPLWALIGGEYNTANATFSKLISYYVRAQFSRYIKTGYTIIDNSAVNSIAALSPNGNELVVVVNNKEAYTQKFNIDLSKFSGIGKVNQIRTRALESLGIKNSLTTLSITGNSITYDAQPESTTTFVIPINQLTAVEQSMASDNKLNIFASEGSIKLFQKEARKCNVTVFNSMGQSISTFKNISTQSLLPAKLPRGIYIVRAEMSNDIFSKTIIIQ